MAGDREKPVEIFSALRISGITAGPIFTEGLTIQGGQSLTFTDGNLNVGTGTGLNIGTATNQKIGFWAATPVIQFATTGETAGHSAVGGTNVNASDTFTGNNGTRAYTINDIVKALKACGIMDVSS